MYQTDYDNLGPYKCHLDLGIQSTLAMFKGQRIVTIHDGPIDAPGTTHIDIDIDTLCEMARICTKALANLPPEPTHYLSDMEGPNGKRWTCLRRCSDDLIDRDLYWTLSTPDEIRASIARNDGFLSHVILRED